MKTQGTELYFIDPADDSVVSVGCVTSIEGIDVTFEQRETTCLVDDTRSYEAGLGTPGAASFGIYTDPQDATHIRLHQLRGVTLQFAVGWSDGTGIEPDTTQDTDGDEIFDPPGTRSWLLFEGFVNSFPFTFAQNASVESQLGVQISGDPQLIAKTST
jgi:hypothetical protein